MARPVGEELARNPTAISRPKGGWFARIWTQRAGPASGHPADLDKIHLERANPFTLWVAALNEPGPKPGENSGQEVMPSRAFTLWTAATIPGNSSGDHPAEDNSAGDSPGDQPIAPFPEGVFEETDEGIVLSGEVHDQGAGAMHSRGHSLVSAPANAFTIWTTPEALASLSNTSTDQLYSQVTAPEVEENTSADDEVSRPEISLIRIEHSGAFTRWADPRYISSASLQESSRDEVHAAVTGEQVQEEVAPALVGSGNSSQGGGVSRLVALAVLIMGLVAAMFVISTKNKEISDLMVDAKDGKKKMNGLKHDKQELKRQLLKEHERSGGLAKELAGLESDFTAAKEDHTKESADQKAKSDQLALSLKGMDSMLEESKKAFAKEQATRVQLESDQKAMAIDFEEVTKKMSGISLKLEDAKRALAASGEREELMEKEMSNASKALEEARVQIAAGKSQLEQSEKRAAQLAAEINKLKAQVDDLKSRPVQPPAPQKPPESKPGPAQDPVPETEPKEKPKEKPNNGPINV
ncbi:MAG: hypothetical protein GY899_01440 [Verrucomicrobiaceae bacterium]|nr:hypothetical protein [Verrucomicrobiaceae bacterium]